MQPAAPADESMPAAWPMIVLRTPEGLDRAEGRRRQADGGHLARPPGPAVRRPTNPAHLAQLEAWMRSYRPDELFDDGGRPCRRAPRAPARAAMPG